MDRICSRSFGLVWIGGTFLFWSSNSTIIAVQMQSTEERILLTTEEYVATLFREHSGHELPFHNYEHTAGVVAAAKEIGSAEGVTGEDLEILLIAAWLHDVGYFQVYRGHEEKSAEVAQAFLQKQGYPQDKLDRVVACILATRYPPKPSNLLEAVICDADLAHLGRNNMNSRANKLRKEWGDKCNEYFSDEEWMKSNLQFLREHQYHTEYAQNTYGHVVEEHIQTLEAKLRKHQDSARKGDEGKSKEEDGAEHSADEKNAARKSIDSRLDEEKQEKKKKKLKKLKKELTTIRLELEDQLGEGEKPNDGKSTSARLDRGIETMFRITSRNHIDLSSMADSKANIMISVNSIIISIVASFLAGTFEVDPHFTFPAILLIGVSLTTIIFSILATRPKVTSGTFTQDDIKARKVNLLFFGNFHSVSLEDYQKGVTAMMNDAEYLYGSMIKDIYFLGQVLGKKYKFLRFSYNVFMYGLIASVMAFLLATLHLW